MAGISCPRCGSPARIGFPLAVRAPETAKAFDPATPSSSAASSRAAFGQGGRGGALDERERRRGERRGVGHEEDVVRRGARQQERADGLREAGELLRAPLRLDVVRQLLVHQEEDGDGVGRAPGLRLGPEQRELEPQAAPVRGEVRVDARCERLEVGPFAGRKERDRGLGDAREAVDPVLAVERERRGPEQLGEPSRRIPPEHLELEGAVAGRQPPLRPEGVLDRPGADRRDAAVVEVDGHVGGQARQPPPLVSRQVPPHEDEEDEAEEEDERRRLRRERESRSGACVAKSTGNGRGEAGGLPSSVTRPGREGSLRGREDDRVDDVDDAVGGADVGLHDVRVVHLDPALGDGDLHHGALDGLGFA